MKENMTDIEKLKLLNETANAEAKAANSNPLRCKTAYARAERLWLKLAKEFLGREVTAEDREILFD